MAKRRVNLDMTGVESYTRCPEGEWLAKVAKIEEGTVQGSGDDCLKARFEVIKGSAKGCNVFETFSLTERALWKLKSFLEAVGMRANGKISLDLDKLEGKVCIIDVIHDEYNGTKRAKISSYNKPEEDYEDEEEDEDEDEEEEEEAPPKKSAKAPAKPAKKAKKPVVEEDDEDEDEDDEDDEEEEEPVKPVKKSTKKAPPAKKAPAKAKKKVEEDEDDDDDWEDDDD